VADVAKQFVTMPSPAGVPTAGFGANPLQGVYVTPAGHRPRTAFVASHVNLDFAEHYLGPLLAQRGYGFLGWNTRFRGAEQYFLLDHAVAEIGAGVNWLYQEAGAERVVLLGNSGGGALMASYQAQALDPHLKPVMGTREVPAAQNLRPAELYVSLAAHPGRPDLMVSCMDPSVTDEADPVSADPRLDMYRPENGPPYPPEFRVKYRDAQLSRNRRVTKWAVTQFQRLADSPTRASDLLFTVPRLWADLRFLDPDIEPSERQVPGCWMGDPLRANYGVWGIGGVNTIRTWLSMWSVDHSQLRIQVQGPRITTPALVIDASADTGAFRSDTDLIYQSLASTSKERHSVTGDHYFRSPAGARDEVADLITAWVEKQS
jgi:hypothetical protein